MEGDEIIYLDPMEIEVDEYNVRYDSPIDEGVVEQIYQDLLGGGSIEYHITVRVRDGKYYCYVGRNRLLAAKKYVEETGNKIKIPAKIKNVDDLEAMNLSLHENLKRRNLSPSEISRALRKIYGLWRERKREEIMKTPKEGEAFHRETLLKEEYHPYDPTNPFSISKFIEENNIPLRKVEVLRLLVLDSLPCETKKGVDNGYIDILTAYELSKFDDQQTIIDYTNTLLNFKHVPRDIKVNAVVKVREEGGDLYREVLNRYREYLSIKYPVFRELSDWHVSHMAGSVPGQRLSKLAGHLEMLVRCGLDLNRLDMETFDMIVEMRRENIEDFVDKIKDLRAIYGGEIVGVLPELLREYMRGNYDVRFVEDRVRSLLGGVDRARNLVIEAHGIYNRCRAFLNFSIMDKHADLGNIINEDVSDEKYIKGRLDEVYEYLFMSPGWRPRKCGEQRRGHEGALWRFYGKRYTYASSLVRDGLRTRNRDHVREGIKQIMDILEEINKLLDHEFHDDLLTLLHRLVNEGRISFDHNEANVLEEADILYIFVSSLWELLEIYIYIRVYIASMDKVTRMARAEEVNRLTELYKGVLRKLVNLEYTAVREYVSSVRYNELYVYITKFLDYCDAVEALLTSLESEYSPTENMDIVIKLNEFRREFREARESLNPVELEHLKYRIEKYLGSFPETVVKIVPRERELSLNIGRDSVEVIPKKYTEEFLEEVEHSGRIYKVRIRLETSCQAECLDNISKSPEHRYVRPSSFKYEN